MKKIISLQENVHVIDRSFEVRPLKLNAIPSNKILFMHAKGFKHIKECEHVLKYLDGLEIKPDKFIGDDRLFFWKNNRLQADRKNFNRLSRIAVDMGLALQTHFPMHKIERQFLDMASVSDWHALLQVYETYAESIADFNLSPNITVHPPIFEKMEEISEKLNIANQFLIKLGEKIKAERWPIIIGMENQADPFIQSFPLEVTGFLPEHLRVLLTGTNDTIQVTYDSGHRLLNKEFTVRELIDILVRMGKYVTNQHFHENEGLDFKGKYLDSHQAAIQGNVRGFNRCVIRSIIDNVPLNLEIPTNLYSPLRLLVYVSGMRNAIDIVWNDERNQQVFNR
ncbi:MAG: hypothetical protein A2Y40_09485 [Candidatus Margulisbacteria bacterium GWF2_35_9]|nr:MAG: hypothetical protein A2Y40_09485 [Candidatus Margulisbacteria bacterium GWF2_35_9]